MSKTNSVLEGPRPWTFTRAELAAGLRRRLADPGLKVTDIEEFELPKSRPSIGRIRGLRLSCEVGGEEQVFQEQQVFDLVLKESQGTTRRGTVGSGRREVSFYRFLANQLPIPVLEMVASHPDGDWMAFDMLPTYLKPETWTGREYRIAIQHLVLLHDRFWRLDEDLANYNWLARPLRADFDIHFQAARNGVQHLFNQSPTGPIAIDIDLLQALNRLIQNAGYIATGLKSQPATLLHGDYWPGNLAILPSGKQITYDWQQAAIGPGLLDLLYFIKSSLWWFGELPLSVGEMVDDYREGIMKLTGSSWTEREWSILWDCALLWTFMTGWIDVLAFAPIALLETRLEQLESIWLEPVRQTVNRLFPKK